MSCVAVRATEWSRIRKRPGRTRAACVSRGARYWDRTSDLFRVREARYRCANRPFAENCFSEVEVDTGFEPVYTALQAAASPLGQPTTWDSYQKEPALRPIPFERMTRFELATLTLAR